MFLAALHCHVGVGQWMVRRVRKVHLLGQNQFVKPNECAGFRRQRAFQNYALMTDNPNQHR